MTKHARVALSSLERTYFRSSVRNSMTYPEPGNHSKPNRKNYNIQGIDRKAAAKQRVSFLFAHKNSKEHYPNKEAKTEKGLAAVSCFRDDKKYDLDISLREMGYYL